LNTQIVPEAYLKEGTLGNVSNYGFDNTPAEFITAFITPNGVCPADPDALRATFPEVFGDEYIELDLEGLDEKIDIMLDKANMTVVEDGVMTGGGLDVNSPEYKEALAIMTKNAEDRDIIATVLDAKPPHDEFPKSPAVDNNIVQASAAVVQLEGEDAYQVNPPQPDVTADYIIKRGEAKEALSNNELINNEPLGNPVSDKFMKDLTESEAEFAKQKTKATEYSDSSEELLPDSLKQTQMTENHKLKNSVEMAVYQKQVTELISFFTPGPRSPHISTPFINLDPSTGILECKMSGTFRFPRPYNGDLITVSFVDPVLKAVKTTLLRDSDVTIENGQFFYIAFNYPPFIEPAPQQIDESERPSACTETL